MDELLARLRAAVRRATTHAGAEEAVVHAGALDIDLAAKQVTRDGAVVHLTPTEWGILEQLVRHQGKLVSQRQLLSEVWGPRYHTETPTCASTSPTAPQAGTRCLPSRHLVTEPGMGYRFQP